MVNNGTSTLYSVLWAITHVTTIWLRWPLNLGKIHYHSHESPCSASRLDTLFFFLVFAAPNTSSSTQRTLQIYWFKQWHTKNQSMTQSSRVRSAEFVRLLRDRKKALKVRHLMDCWQRCWQRSSAASTSKLLFRSLSFGFVKSIYRRSIQSCFSFRYSKSTKTSCLKPIFMWSKLPVNQILNWNLEMPLHDLVIQFPIFCRNQNVFFDEWRVENSFTAVSSFQQRIDWVASLPFNWVRSRVPAPLLMKTNNYMMAFESFGIK